MKKKLSYDEAIHALEDIVKSIESGELTVDDLNTKIKEATTLVNYCKTKLRSTEEDLNKSLDEIL